MSYLPFPQAREVILLLTYTLKTEDSRPLYEQLAAFLREDILRGTLPAGGRLPSKRSLAGNLGVSSITVEAAYNRLIDEGFVLSEPRRGYFVAELALRPPDAAGAGAAAAPAGGMAGAPAGRVTGPRSAGADLSGSRSPGGPGRFAVGSSVGLTPGGAFSASALPVLDLSGSRAPADRFPFTVWTRLLRGTVNDLGGELLQPSPFGGVPALREAIAGHLRSFRGMQADPDCIIVGAGTEYLYGLLIQLLGRDRIYCLEDPGYRKPAQIYRAAGAQCRWAPLDEGGLSVPCLEATGADVAHVSPTHHFPTGITMPVGRRYELLQWAAAGENRWIIEDDYDSEFRLTGRPIPTLQSIDRNGTVIYMNTFSRSLASTVRISYMVLPQALMRRYADTLGFYSCTVSNFEQYTLARFIGEGYFEKHLNRMRLFYARLRRELLQRIAESPVADRIRVVERDSGLHFLLELQTARPDEDLHAALLREGIRFNPLSFYYLNPGDAPEHTFLLSYSALSPAALDRALGVLGELL